MRLTFNLGQAGPQDATGNAGSTADTDAAGSTGGKGSASDGTITVVPAR